MQKYNKALIGFASTIAANVMARVAEGSDIWSADVWLVAVVSAVAVGGLVYQIPNKTGEA